MLFIFLFFTISADKNPVAAKCHYNGQ